MRRLVSGVRESLSINLLKVDKNFDFLLDASLEKSIKKEEYSQTNTGWPLTD